MRAQRCCCVARGVRGANAHTLTRHTTPTPPHSRCSFVVALLPQLMLLDDKEVGEEERAQARAAGNWVLQGLPAALPDDSLAASGVEAGAGAGAGALPPSLRCAAILSDGARVTLELAPLPVPAAAAAATAAAAAAAAAPATQPLPLPAPEPSTFAGSAGAVPLAADLSIIQEEHSTAGEEESVAEAASAPPVEAAGSSSSSSRGEGASCGSRSADLLFLRPEAPILSPAPAVHAPGAGAGAAAASPASSTKVALLDLMHSFRAVGSAAPASSASVALGSSSLGASGRADVGRFEARHAQLVGALTSILQQAGGSGASSSSSSSVGTSSTSSSALQQQGLPLDVIIAGVGTSTPYGDACAVLSEAALAAPAEQAQASP